MVRLLVILGLLLQPMLIGAGPLICRPVETPFGTGCCAAVAPSCCSSSGDAGDLHHCGKPGLLCQCRAPGPEQPMAPTPQARFAETLSAILPRLVAVTMEVPLPERSRARAIPAAVLPGGAELRAYLCVWLT
jgi:hypothetical protein